MKKNTGKPYEHFVQTLYQAILAAEFTGFGGQKNIKVETNKVLTGKNGIKREFDIYWEFTQGGFIYKNVIECKDYNSKIKIEKIDALESKLRDFPNLVGIFATTKGYQSGAEQKARDCGIELLIVREQNDEDWTDKDGTPCLREINISMNAIFPASITNLDFKLPLNSKLPKTNEMNNQIVICNLESGDRYTAHDLQFRLLKDHEESDGEFEKEYLFKGKVILPDAEFQILGYKVNYIIHKIAVSEINIDFSKKLKGVIEFLNQGRKAKVYDEFVNFIDE
ncbi:MULTISPECIES: restriction endonuclease [Acinetobacter calcoaceticus/baumannii complex]|uniref:restriction endonuclease n=1 Tax=Acinetobacter calcoaceticus/baumannii complex TaxID=909768 RepID=UPI0002AEB172|nr:MULTISPECIES: restriction endonuclease [Acinetobacter calcoaceticus/baumannii complex]QJJ19879.1 restriction endonuclease [Klebsiella pneumoniae]EJB8466325.1 restriction endonuclease [Acinetobacter baumannii]ELW80571.1 restriction endonuclease [Acinetobacter sp. OIFC021]KMV08453.1 restriction endonuclease family protein [Acinetobacter baumannii]MBI1408654.1 restriction endonuclease [Acinetobacter baumannii]